MNRSFLLILAVLYFTCELISAKPMTETDAEKVVTGWLKADREPLGQRFEPYIRYVDTYRDENGEPLYYVVGLESDGFIIISTNDMVEPVIAFSSSGLYDASPGNPLEAFLKKDLRARIRAVQNSIPAAASKRSLFSAQNAVSQQKTSTQKKWQFLIDLRNSPKGDIGIMSLPDSGIDDPRVDPLLDIEGIAWGQRNLNCGDACYNYFTPHVADGQVVWERGHTDNFYCGCVPTSMAQLMRFHRHPKKPVERREITAKVELEEGTVTEEEALMVGGSGLNGEYDWDLMVPRPDCEAENEDQRMEIGALCFDAGLAARTTYGANSSSTNYSDAKQALVDDFYFSNAIYAWCSGCDYLAGLMEMLNPNLDAGMPVILSLNRYEEDESKGHSVVCDGYGYHASTLYHHLNLGWEKDDRTAYDAWYNLPDVNSPSWKYVETDGCIYNIFPDGIGEIISGRVLRENGTPWAQADVWLVSEDGSDMRSTTTNSRGIYAFAYVNSNTAYTITIMNSSYADCRVKTSTSIDGCPVPGNRWAVDFPYVMETRIIYVDAAAAGTNDGSSWIHAFNDLQDAITTAAGAASQETEIWVARGTYVPDRSPNPSRFRSFYLINGVSIYGGFAGWETNLHQRNPGVNVTTLSGDLNNNDEPINYEDVLVPDPTRSDNSYHVVRSCGNNDTAVLDGFTIANGYADGSDPNNLDRQEYGAGIRIYQNSGPVLKNCVLRDNIAMANGGAIFIDVNSAPAMNNCLFESNFAVLEAGGAIFNDDRSHVTVADCSFVGNESIQGWGGAIYSDDNSQLEIVGCDFITNNANVESGGAIVNDSGSQATIKNCNFTGNGANGSGGAIINYDECFVTISDCNFIENESVQGWGGAIYSSVDTQLEILNCSFSSNSAVEHSGGAVYNDERCHATITECNFDDNQARWGGAVYSYFDSALEISGSSFSCNNATEQSGGAVFNDERSQATVKECNFESNQAKWGGALYNNNDSGLEIIACDFIANRTTEEDGGAIVNSSGSQATIKNCNFTVNEANDSGGAIMNYDECFVTISDCNFIENESVQGWGGAIYGGVDTQFEILNCSFSSNSAVEHSGGAVFIDDRCQATITECNFDYNKARWGGAIYSDNESQLEIYRCSLTGNVAYWYGGAVNKQSGNATLANCLLSENSANQGGAAFIQNSILVCNNCLFYGNKAISQEESSGFGGVFFAYGETESCRLDLQNCTLSDNSATGSGNGICCYSADGLYPLNMKVSSSILWDIGAQVQAYTEEPDVVISYSCVRGGRNSAVYPVSNKFVWGDGNILDDPLFNNVSLGNYRLKYGSPCIDAGDPDFLVEIGLKDLDGLPRLADGDGDAIAIVDMGAYEYHAE